MPIVFNPLTSQFDIKGTGGGGGGGGPAERFLQTFNATTDWGSPSGGYYTITVLAASHALGTDPTVEIYENISSEYFQVTVDEVKVNTSGDVSFRVPSSPDLRFAGKVIII